MERGQDLESLLSGLGQDVLVGLLGAGLLSALTLLIQAIRGALVRRNFPLAGIYISKFEDYENGALVVTKALVDLRQRGRTLSGDVRLLDGGRTWSMEGRIHGDGRVSGSYRASDPRDTGLGAFFLELQDGGMDGMWSGYDSQNKAVTAGRWSFQRIKEQLVEKTKREDIDKVTALLGSALGVRYLSKNDVTSYLEGENSTVFSLKSAEDGTIVGAAIATLLDATAPLHGIVPSDQVERVEHVIPELEFNKVSYLKSLAVSPKNQGLGGATALVRAAVQWSSERSATIVFAVGWKDKQGCHIQGVLEGLEFKAREELSDFWLMDSKERDYECPSCGETCRCGAVLFSRRI